MPKRRLRLKPRNPHRKAGGPCRGTRPPPPTEKQKETIAALFAQNMSQKKIAEHAGVTLHQVRWVMLQKGLTFSDRYPGVSFNTKVTHVHKKMMTRLFEKGYSYRRIAQRLQLSSQTVARVLHMLGKRRRGEHVGADTRLLRKAESRQSPEFAEPTLISPTPNSPSICENSKPKRAGRKHQTKDSTCTRVALVRSFGSTDNDTSCVSNTKDAPEERLAVKEAQDKASPETVMITVNCHSSLFHCGACSFQTGMEEQVISHLLRPVHEGTRKKKVILVCTGCRFKTRQPMKMIHHAIKYWTRPDDTDAL